MNAIRIIFFFPAFLLFIIAEAKQPTVKKEAFDLLNLEHPGLATVKKLVAEEKYEKAAKALLDYYRNRTTVQHPDYNLQDKADYLGKPIAKDAQQKADHALAHFFQPHKGYGFFDYGKDINWQYWPVKDNEVRWQLHRVYWWQPMGLAYRSSGDEKYAKEWVYQFRDWMKKNPLGLSKENDSFAWRPLEVSERIQSLPGTFNLFISSQNFTAEFLLEFLASYHQQANYIPQHYSEEGNHLLFEAQRILGAGAFFPEFKDAGAWRKTGIDVLSREIKKQVFADGMQWELSPVYHNASIDIFLRAYRSAQLAGVEKDFPESYRTTIEKMILASMNFSFPDYTFPMFGDSWLSNKTAMLKQISSWLKAFPKNEVINYFATDGKEGKLPRHLSYALKDAGFYTFRNGWNASSTVMVLKASPPGEFHAQPDNGTFDLWVKGRNFMPDAGCYVYSGDAEIMKMREWYRQTVQHKTLTLDNKNQEITNAKLIGWKTSEQLDQLVYSNPSYKNLEHKRTVLFIDKKYFVIVDEANGVAQGTAGIHFQLAENSNPVYDKQKNKVQTGYTDGNNLLIQTFSTATTILKEEEAKVSYEYRKELPRPAFVFEQQKNTANNYFITVLYPFDGSQAPSINLVENAMNNIKDGKLNLTITINGSNQQIATNIIKQ